MGNNIEYKTNDVIDIVAEKEQMNMFDNNEVGELKYRRRNKQTISSKSFDLLPPNEADSKKMQRINSRGTAIEHQIEYALIRAKFQYSRPEQLIGEIDGKPDFVIPRYKIAIFCDGDFWHGNDLNKLKIKNNSEFWQAKIENNMVRNEKVNYGLKASNWKVFRFWEHEIKKDAYQCVEQVKNYIIANYPEKEYKFSFVDLFSGIGGFRLPLNQLGGKCLGFSEIDKYAIETYKTNFWDLNSSDDVELGSITNLFKLPFKDIDLIVGGVPCQSWSVAGKMRGFDDPRGKLWEDTIRVVKLNQPKAFIFENVKGLIDPRNKENLSLIINNFQKLGYIVKYRLLNSYDFGLPQNRDRIFIVGIRKNVNLETPFDFPSPTGQKSFLHDIIDGLKSGGDKVKKTFLDPKELFGNRIPKGRNRFQKSNELNDFFIFCDTRNGHTTIHSWDIYKTTKREKEICMTILKNRRKSLYGTQDGNPMSFKNLKDLIPDLQKHELTALIEKNILKLIDKSGYVFVNSKNSAGINGLYRIYLPHSNIFSTLTATGTKDVIALKTITADTPKEYKELFIKEIINKKEFRPISGKEAGKLQGFPNDFAIHRTETMAKKQFGNAVSTTVIYNLAKSLLQTHIFRK